jgi:nucleoside triphosphate pyrophosphatase
MTVGLALLGDRSLVLASGSPRRRQLLALLGVDFTVLPPEIDETPGPDEAARDLVTRLATEKGAAVAVTHPDAVVIAADTCIDVGGVVLGKPVDADDARRMLRLLGGRAHLVHTGVAVAVEGAVATTMASSEVVFAPLNDDDIDWYVGTGEPLDKAGGYALQGAGGVFVERVDGSVSGVLGLPLHETARLLERRLALSGRGC